MTDEIIELLENSKLREVVMKTIQKLWVDAGSLYDNPNEYMEEYLEKNKDISLWEEAWWQAENPEDIGKIEKAFGKYVVQKIARPYRLTLDELASAFFDLAKPNEDYFREFEQFSSDECNSLYVVFVNYVMNHILSHRYSAPFPICRVTNKEEGEWLLEGVALGYQLAMSHTQGKELQPRDLDVKSSGEETTVWDKNGVGVRLLRGADVIKETPGGKKLYYLLAVIEGKMSTLACSMLQNEMSRILPTAIRSTDLLQAEGFGGEYKVIEPTIPLLYEREIGGLPWGGEKLIESAKPMIRQYLDAYYSDSRGKKDSLNRRIRNAVCLLIESDNQPNNAVGLALSITAMEALLGEKVYGITKILSERVGALLEPDRSQRNNTTIFLKKLYGARSDALHGRSVEKNTEARTYARHVAAAVLSSVISRRDFRRRADYELETPQELLQDLDRSFASGEATGIEEYNVRGLWKNRATGKNASGL